MSEATSSRDLLESRLLVLPVTQRDAVMTDALLTRAGIHCVACPTMRFACEQLKAGAGALLLAEENVSVDGNGYLREWLAQQPAWSDLPILVLARSGADSPAVAHAVELFGNVTVLERPVRLAALVSGVRAALRARQRQYQIRDHLVRQERDAQVHALLAAIVESSDDAILSKTLDGRILTWNAGAERLFGYTAAEVIGKPTTVLIPADRLAEEPELISRLRKGERVDHYETVRVAKDGRRIDLSLTVSPIRDSSGRVVGASKVARDISERKRSETALRDADRRKDEFLAILAHELRNPLAPIRNSLHVLRLSGHRDPTVERVGEMIERQVGHLVRLVDDLLEVSRITRGKLELRTERLEVAAFVASAVETSQPLIEAARHEFVVTLPDERLVVEGDPVRLAQVVSNLLNNSAKYTEAGGKIWLTVTREGSSVAIAVRDSGVGIQPEMLAHAFELFTQIDRRSERRREGLGIGLTLAKSLVEMHGGTVTAHSEGIGRGSEFTVRLPLATPQAGEAEDKASPHQAARPLPQRRVLVVDDNRDAAQSLGMLLKLLGADVHVTYSGPEALEAVRTYRPAVVLLDIGMPGMDGHEVAKRIRAQPEVGPVTLIALTGWGQDEDRRRSRAAGFDYHLIKPADLSALETLLLSLDSRQPVA